ncbi:MAG: hypothetical protein VYE29_03615 [Pseudomonadota bacterium]|nr:hypothetical protein [Pseudomonadota bacterium]
METWNNLIDKFDQLLMKVKLESTVKIAGREIPPFVMAFVLIGVCFAIWTYLEFAGSNKLIGALVVVLMAWAVAQLSALGLGDGFGVKPGTATDDKSNTSGNMSESAENSSSVEHSMGESEAQLDKQKRLALYTFAGVIIALLLIYQMRNIDSFQDMRNEFRYSELIEMVEPIQDTIEAALLSGSSATMDFLDSGQAGLPDEVLVSEDGHGISVIDGQIIATWMTDGSKLEGVTYILTPKIENGEIEWATTGTCGGKNAC